MYKLKIKQIGNIKYIIVWYKKTKIALKLILIIFFFFLFIYDFF